MIWVSSAVENVLMTFMGVVFKSKRLLYRTCYSVLLLTIRFIMRVWHPFISHVTREYSSTGSILRNTGMTSA